MIALVLVSLLAAGCGPKEPAATTTTIVMPGGTLADRFQGRSPRLRVAREEIGALLGHALEIRIDAAFEPRWSSAADEHIERIVVELGQALKAMETRSPKRFAEHKGKLRVVQYEFDATAPNSDAVFDAGNGVLRISVSQRDVHGCPCHRIANAFFEAGRKDERQRFQGKEAQAIPSEQLAAYAEWQSDQAGFGTDKNSFGEPRATNMRRVFDAHERMSPSKARDELRAKLIGELQSVTDFKNRERDLVAAATPQSPWGRFEEAYAQWLIRNVPSFSVAERAKALEGLTIWPQVPDLGSFDVVGLGLGIIDRWLADGMPLGRRALPPETEALVDTVCPFALESGGEFRQQVYNCKGFWSWTRGDERRLQRVAQHLLSKQNPDLVQALFAHLVDDGRRGGGQGKGHLAAWRRFAADQPSWSAAMRVLAVSGNADDSDVLGEAVRVARSEPQRRGLTLLIFAGADKGRSGTRTKAERRTDFERSYGPVIGASEFRDYFAHGAVAFRYAAWLVPYLQKGVQPFRCVLVCPRRLLQWQRDEHQGQRHGHAGAGALCRGGACGPVQAEQLASRLRSTHPQRGAGAANTCGAIREAHLRITWAEQVPITQRLHPSSCAVGTLAMCRRASGRVVAYWPFGTQRQSQASAWPKVPGGELSMARATSDFDGSMNFRMAPNEPSW